MAFSRRSFLKCAPLLTALPAISGRAAPSRSLEQRLIAAFDKLEIADTHEHFYDEPDRLAMHADFFTLAEQSYVMSDLISAGLPPESSRLIRNQQAPERERWRAFEPYWKNTRFTGYGQALRIAVRDLYGKEISASNLPAINEAIRSRNKPGLYRYVLQERARIRFCVEDDSCGGCTTMPSTQENARVFVLARRFDKFIAPSTPADIRELESITGVSITTFADLTKATEKSFQQNLDQGMRAVKVALAYYRDLVFQEANKADAERDFEALMREERPLPEGFRKSFVRPFRKLEDHMFHYVMRLADAHGLPVQIHTGMFAGNGGLLTNSKPTNLINTFQLYPRINFDIFHISYPYQEELGVLAKSFPNVYADFCWAYVISPVVSRRTLHEFLDIAPANKILGFGGDYKHPELAYAHAMMARRAVGQVLAAKVEDGVCTEQEAFELGKTLLYENAARLFSWTRPPSPFSH
jgi:predicted TIM-barrel fold metal-dependent hydrolase